VTQWNHEAENVTGISAEKAQGQDLTEIFPQLAGKMESIHSAIQQREPQKHGSVILQNDKEPRYSDITIYPLLVDRVEGAVIRVDDVTERVHMEEMMIQSEKMMTVGGLAAGMAHEINNPLGVILQGIQNTLRRLSPEVEKNQEIAEACDTDLVKIQTYLEQRNIIQYLNGIREAGLRASKIVTDMLNFSRCSESKMLPTNINHVLDKTIGLAANDYDLKKKYDFKHINIIREYDSTLPEILCAETEIEQVILNLLKNAAQAIAEKSKNEYAPQIRICTRKDQDYALIELEDNGPGINEDIRKHIFEPFYTTKTVGIGTGLGLSVSYFIITNNHQGTMAVESSLNRGTKFIIRLPFERNR
jgi:PAS domain S-box-containing protein